MCSAQPSQSGAAASAAADAPAVAAPLTPAPPWSGDEQTAASAHPPSSSSSSSSPSDSSDRAGGDVAEWAHPPGDRAKIHFLTPASSLRNCAMGADIAGSGVGLLSAKETGRNLCKFCFHRLNINDPEASNAVLPLPATPRHHEEQRVRMLQGSAPALWANAPAALTS